MATVAQLVKRQSQDRTPLSSGLGSLTPFSDPPPPALSPAPLSRPPLGYPRPKEAHWPSAHDAPGTERKKPGGASAPSLAPNSASKSEWRETSTLKAGRPSVVVETGLSSLKPALGADSTRDPGAGPVSFLTPLETATPSCLFLREGLCQDVPDPPNSGPSSSRFQKQNPTFLQDQVQVWLLPWQLGPHRPDHSFSELSQGLTWATRSHLGTANAGSWAPRPKPHAPARRHSPSTPTPSPALDPPDPAELAVGSDQGRETWDPVVTAPHGCRAVDSVGLVPGSPRGTPRRQRPPPLFSRAPTPRNDVWKRKRKHRTSDLLSTCP